MNELRPDELTSEMSSLSEKLETEGERGGREEWGRRRGRELKWASAIGRMDLLVLEGMVLAGDCAEKSGKDMVLCRGPRAEKLWFVPCEAGVGVVDLSSSSS